MSDVLALPAAQPPPTPGLRPPAHPGAGQSSEPDGPPPFEAALAEAAVQAEAEGPAEAVAPLPPDLNALAALAALLNTPAAALPVAVLATAPAAEAESAGASIAAFLTGAAQASEPAGDAPAPAAAQAPQTAAGFPAWLNAASDAVSGADSAVVSDAALKTQAAPLEHKAPVKAQSTTAEPEVQTPLTPAAAPTTTAPAQPALEPARLAEAHEATTLRPTPEVVLPQIVRGAETLSRSGQTTLHLHLQPEALGRIDLQLTTGADGVRVTLTADLAATGNLLQQNLGDLRQSLTASGLSLTALSVGVGGHHGGSTYARGQAWSAPRGVSISAPLKVEAPPEPAPAAGDGARVDYRI